MRQMITFYSSTIFLRWFEPNHAKHLTIENLYAREQIMRRQRTPIPPRKAGIELDVIASLQALIAALVMSCLWRKEIKFDKNPIFKLSNLKNPKFIIPISNNNQILNQENHTHVDHIQRPFQQTTASSTDSIHYAPLRSAHFPSLITQNWL